jgi:hypothetical protein
MAVAFSGRLDAAERPDISSELRGGKLAEAEQALKRHLEKQEADDLARFQLGAVQVMRAIERLAQDGARYGAFNHAVMVPFLRTGAFAPAGDPEPATYDDLRRMIERFQTSVVQAESTLAAVDDDQLKWHLNLDEVLLDLNGDGQALQRENLGTLFRLASNRGRDVQQPAAEDLTVGFDSADVYWLRGYCHLLAAMADAILAYDHQRLFDVTAHVILAKPQTEFASRLARRAQDDQRDEWDEIPDLIAAIHLADFQLREPKRLAAAQQHLLQMIEMSRKNWNLIETETDNDREWIPGADQHSVIAGLEMNRERINAWGRFLNEAEQVIKGEKLLPFWRNGFEEGVNLGKVFTEPRDFDLVLWVQGVDALPYLEKGGKTSPETWREFQRVFRGEFIGFAAWIN